MDQSSLAKYGDINFLGHEARPVIVFEDREYHHAVFAIVFTDIFSAVSSTINMILFKVKYILYYILYLRRIPPIY
jgi:hypothetical protein